MVVAGVATANVAEGMATEPILSRRAKPAAWLASPGGLPTNRWPFGFRDQDATSLPRSPGLRYLQKCRCSAA